MKLRIKTLDLSVFTIDVDETDTVMQVREKIKNNAAIKKDNLDVVNVGFRFKGQLMYDIKRLSSYGIKENDIIDFEKEHKNTRHLKLVKKADAITGDDSLEQLRAEMSCGHAVDPGSLTGWCRSLIDDEQTEFYCPALLDDRVSQKCGKQWCYDEVK